MCCVCQNLFAAKLVLGLMEGVLVGFAVRISQQGVGVVCLCVARVLLLLLWRCHT